MEFSSGERAESNRKLVFAIGKTEVPLSAFDRTDASAESLAARTLSQANDLRQAELLAVSIRDGHLSGISADDVHGIASDMPTPEVSQAHVSSVGVVETLPGSSRESMMAFVGRRLAEFAEGIRVAVREALPDHPEIGTGGGERDSIFLSVNPENRKALAAGLLTVTLSGIGTLAPTNEAEAGWFGDSVKVAGEEIGKGAGRGVRRGAKDAGTAVGGVMEDIFGSVRRGIGFKTPNEQRIEERAAEKARRVAEKEQRAEEKAESNYDAKAISVWNGFMEKVIAANDGASLKAVTMKALLKLQQLDSGFLQISMRSDVYKEAMRRVMDGKVSPEQLVRDQRGVLLGIHNELFPVAQPVDASAVGEKQSPSGIPSGQSSQETGQNQDNRFGAWDGFR